MQNRLIPALFAAAFLFIIIGLGCTKLDTTTLGSDLVAVDNINTFEDPLVVYATQGYFSNDSTAVGKRENHVIGKITNDPLFGSTDAAIYVQFKPSFYPFYFGNAGDTVKSNLSPFAGLDSAFVTLSFTGLYGDTSGMTPQHFQVRQIIDTDFRNNNDSLRKLNYQPSDLSPLFGEAYITPQIVKSKVLLANGQDSVQNQIRIKLNAAGMAYINAIYNQDSSAIGPNNAFYRDSLFRNVSHGFEITATQGNTLYYVSLDESRSRLEFHFRKTKNGIRQAIYQSFPFYPARFGTTASSSSANYVKRNNTGSPAGTPSQDYIYMQTAPGTFANINIPQLTGYSNKIIHRAYLVAEQVPFDQATDNMFTPPPFLYLDIKDTTTSVPQRYKPIYFDLSNNVSYNPDANGSNALYHPFPVANVDVNNFGGAAKVRYDPVTGAKFVRYEINITRYVQRIVSKGYNNYDLRLYAPFNYMYPQYAGPKFLIPFYNPIALGRVRLGNGFNNAHKMKLVIVYSKI